MSISGADADLACPLCRRPVARESSGCRACSLPIADVLRDASEGRARRSVGQRIGVRLTGLLIYAGLVGWAWWQLPQTLPFVVLGAGLGGGFFHVVKARPWVGLVVFVVVVFVVPRLLWSAFGMGALSDLADHF